MKEKESNLKLHKWVVLGIIIVFIVVGSLAGVIFPGTAFATVIDSSIGKFFDVVSLVMNNYINILESAAIILFVSILYYVVSVLIKLFTRKSSRGETLGILITSVAKFAGLLIAFILILVYGEKLQTLFSPTCKKKFPKKIVFNK